MIKTMAKVENRVDQAVRRINEGLDKMKIALAGTENLDRVIAHERARHFDAVILKYLNTNDPDERISRRFLQRSRHQLMKQANRSIWNRIFPEIESTVLSVLDFFRDKKQEKNQLMQREAEAKDLADHHSELITEVAKKGYPEVAGEITAGIKRGAESFVVKWSVYKQAHEKVEYDLHFKKDAQGKYHLEWCEGHLLDKNKKIDRRLTVQAGSGLSFDSIQLYNLLSGRAVQLGDLKYLIDLHDVGANGSHALRPSVAVREKFMNTFADLPFMQNRDPDFLVDVANMLLNGDRLPFTHTDKAGRTTEFILEANSQHTGVNYYDVNSVRTEFEKLFPVNPNGGNDVKPLRPDAAIPISVDEQRMSKQEIQQTEQIWPAPLPGSHPDGRFAADEGLSPAYLEHGPEIAIGDESFSTSATQHAAPSAENIAGGSMSPPAKGVQATEQAVDATRAVQDLQAVTNTSGRHKIYGFGEQITPGGIILPDNRLSLDQVARNALQYGKEPIRDFFQRQLAASEANSKKQQQSHSRSIGH